MPVEAFLVWLVVVGRYLEGAINADFLGALRKFQCFGCGICPGAGNHLDASAGRFYAGFDDLDVFVDIQGRGFSRRSHGDNAVYPARDLLFDQACKDVERDLSIAVERSHDGCMGSLKHGHFLTLRVRFPVWHVGPWWDRPYCLCLRACVKRTGHHYASGRRSLAIK